MEIEEYKSRLEELGKEFIKKKNALAREYANSNNTVKEGDIFTDHIGSIRVENIGYEYDFNTSLPSCIYEGPELKADGTPKKNEARRTAYQTKQKK